MSTDSTLGERLRFMKLDERSLDHLRSVKSLIMSELPRALARFYEQVRSFPEARKFFSSDQHMDAAGARQIAHWDAISSGKLDQNYVAAVTKVGEIHARIGLEPRWYIGGYALLAESLVGAVLKARWPGRGYFTKGPDVETVAAEAGAMIKAIMLDMDFAISVYISASEASRKKVEAQMQATNAAVIASVTEAFGALADGNLTYRMADNLPPEYAKMRQDCNEATAKLQEVMSVISTSAEAIRSGTGEISQASTDLSRRTEQQAASIEETAAALSQITSTFRKTAEGAAQACVVVATAKKDAELSGEVVHNAVGAMGEIEKSSDKIGQIIGVIDEIAFQTNLLALNAGVEAARAGDAGRGFAVVASEVRALAQRSAEAAKEIKALISASTAQVEAGVKLVGEAGQSLQRIVGSVLEINTLVVDIAAAAKNEVGSLQEVNTAVTQMDQMTQQNAAMVEESTAACHTLDQEASELGRMVSRFNIGDAQGGAPATRNPASTTQLKEAGRRQHASAGR
ncbi:MAG: globin-coupled sensor protein [Beijerinckiaceae bacterium]|nr:globin-coupled sensor protein [Beijerinckiaceae bacterium]